MQDFWAGITGDAEQAFGNTFTLIPDGTMLRAEISHAVVNKETNVYELTWTVLEGEFKGRKVWQKIRCFDQKPEKAKKAREMLRLLYTITQLTPPAGPPGELDLMAFQSRICSILIREWHIEGKSGNYVAEVHDPSSASTTTIIESAFSRNPPVQNLDGDIPF